MQSIIKLIQAFVWAWDFAKKHPKKSVAAGAVGAGALTMGLYSSVSYPPPLIHAGNTSNVPGSDGQAVTTNGDGTYTIETISAGATTLDGLSDVIVTSPSDNQFLRHNGSEWVNETVAVAGLLTPDRVTSVELANKYSVADYKASPSGKKWHATTSTSGTTTVTIKDTTGSATTHDFYSGEGIVIWHGGAVSTVAAPTVSATASSVANVGSAGSTTYTYNLVAIDGSFGHSAKSSDIATTTGNATLSESNYNLIRAQVPVGAKAIAIYRDGQLVTILDATHGAKASTTDTDNDNVSLDNNGGSLRMTFTSAPNLSVNDYVRINATSSGDDAYDGVHQIASSADSTHFTLSTAYGASLDATGRAMYDYVEWKDVGVAGPLMATKFLPDEENPNWDWRAGIAQVRGNLCVGTSSAAGNPVRMYRAIATLGDRRTDFDGTPNEPPWTDNPDTIFVDNDVYWQREIDIVPLTPPASAGRQWLDTTVASTPTASTLTLTDAVSADIASNTLCVMHNNIRAFRACLAAIRATGQGGTMYVPAGRYPMYLPAPADTTYWTNIHTSTQPYYCAMVLNTGVSSNGYPAINIDMDPQAEVSWHTAANRGVVEDVPAGGVEGQLALIGFAGRGTVVQGGFWRWNLFSGGLTEHDTTSSYSNQIAWGLDAAAGSSALGQEPQDSYILNTQISAPNWIVGNGLDSDYDGSNARRIVQNVAINYGGGDADQVLVVHGQHIFNNIEVRQERRLGSQAFYFNSGKYRQILNAARFRDIQGSGKFCFQIRGSAGDLPSEYFSISNIICQHCNSVTLGDQTISNQVNNIQVTNWLGGSMIVAEARDVSVVNFNGPTLSLDQDVSRCNLSNLNCKLLDLTAADVISELEVNNVTTDKLSCSGLKRATINGVTLHNSVDQGTIYTSGVYEWVATGSNNEYYCRNRATGGDPSISSPTGVSVRGRVTWAAGTLGSLAGDTWYYGDPDGAGAIAYNTIVVKVYDDQSYDPDSLPQDGNDGVCAVTTTVPCAWTGSWQDVIVSNVNITRTDGQLVNTFNSAGPSQMQNVKWIGFNVSNSVEVSTTTNRAVDFGGTSLTWKDVLLKDWLIRCAGETSNSTQVQLKLYVTADSHVVLDNVDTPYMTGQGDSGGWDLAGAGIRNVDMFNCDIGTNRSRMYLDVSTDLVSWPSGHAGTATAGGNSTITLASGASSVDDYYNGLQIVKTQSPGNTYEVAKITDYVGSTKVATVDIVWRSNPSAAAGFKTTYVIYDSLDLVTAANTPVIFVGPNTPPGGITLGTTYYVLTNGTTSSISTLSAGAAINMTGTSVPLDCYFPWMAKEATHAANEAIAGNTVTQIGQVSNNTIRGSRAREYDQIAATSNNQFLFPTDVHVFTTDASRQITGFAGGVAGRRITIINGGAQDLTLDHNNGAGTSTAQNKIWSFTGADLTLSSGDSLDLVCQDEEQGWRAIGGVAYLEQPGQLRLWREELVAMDERRRFGLVLAA